MKLITFIFSVLLLLNVSIKAQESNQLTAGVGYVDGFHEQMGIEFTIEYEGKIIGEWTGLYVQSRTAYLNNYGSSYDGYDLFTSRYDLAIGINQYLTPELSIWRPRIGIGAFISIQDFEEDLSYSSYQVTTDISVGLEWGIMSLWVVDNFAWGFAYKGTYHKFQAFDEDIKTYDNHFMLVCAYEF